MKKWKNPRNWILPKKIQKRTGTLLSQRCLAVVFGHTKPRSRIRIQQKPWIRNTGLFFVELFNLLLHSSGGDKPVPLPPAAGRGDGGALFAPVGRADERPAGQLSGCAGGAAGGRGGAPPPHGWARHCRWALQCSAQAASLPGTVGCLLFR